MRRATAGPLLLVAALALVALAALTLPSDLRMPARAEAQDLEAQALQIERQLLCPQCTNKRLDVCELPICQDMRQLIRERLAAGSTPDDILLFFSNRYGERVLADLPKSGFNLVLFGWVGGSVALVALAGGLTLLRLRRTAARSAAGRLADADERWLDAQLDADQGTR